MAKTTLSAIALLAACATLPASAQTAEAPATEAPAEETAPAAGADPGLSMGTEVGGDDLGQTYTSATFGEWEQRCVRTASGIDPCQLYKLLQDETGNAVAELTLFSLPAGSEGPAVAGATFIAPLETLLTAGMTLQIDAGPAKAYPFTFCAPVGCVARLGFTAEEVDQMKRGANATITIVPFVAPEERVTLQVSLSGFTAGLAAVDAANAAADAAAAAAGEAAPAANE
jgi:invasion protein IalB